MEYTELGSTGLDVSVLSLGAGGPSRLGINRGKTEKDAHQVVETAIDRGVNLIDTAPVYGTEEIVGNVVETKNRDDLILSTKYKINDGNGERHSPEELEESLEKSLECLNTNYIDIYHLHAVKPSEYEYAVETMYPSMKCLMDNGKIRFIGITESVSSDPGHEMLTRAVNDGLWDVVMVGFNLLNQSARERVLKPAEKNGIGTIGMVAVRRALANPNRLEETVDELISMGELDPTEIDPRAPFGFLIHNDGGCNLIDAAYRFCRHESTLNTVLTGTSSPEHLRANVRSVLKGPLPEEDIETLQRRFGHIDSVIGN